MHNAPNINLAWTMLAVEECFRLGVRHAVICPGSRSAPLAIAFARHGKIQTHVAHDERAGAFMALGVAKSSGFPAVIVMTSGTAVANALPAVVEARMSRTPLLVFSADRPPELRDCGANQAISQAGLLAGAARWCCDIPCPSEQIAAEYILSTVDEAFARACGDAGAQAGASHLNWQFREPLAPEIAPWNKNWLSTIARWTKNKSRAPWRATRAVNATNLSLTDTLVIAGRCNVATRESLSKWRGTMLADVTSGLAAGATVGADLVLRAAYDGSGNPALREALRVQAVAVVGDAVVSKRLNAWINRQENVMVFGAGDPRVDPSHRASGAYYGPVVLKAGARLRPHAGWMRALSCATRAARKAMANESALVEPTAIADASSACAKLKIGTLFYGSSMPIRDAEFLALHPPRGWHVGSNRGASGIDGLLATAVGQALASGQPVVAFVGDVSALHDLNTLQLASRINTPLVLIVLNNDGGGIFRYLPVAKHADVFTELFTTPHGRAFTPIAKAFELANESPTTRAAFSKCVSKALARKGATLIEVRCQAQASEAARARIANASIAALAKEFR